MTHTGPGTTLFYLAVMSYYTVLALQFVLITVQFVLFLLDWVLSAAEQSLEPLKFYLSLFSVREQYDPADMRMMEIQLMQYRMVRWWRQAMDQLATWLLYGGSAVGTRMSAWGIPVGVPAFPRQWRRPGMTPVSYGPPTIGL